MSKATIQLAKLDNPSNNGLLFSKFLITSLLFTILTSSIRSKLSKGGKKPAPNPWIKFKSFTPSLITAFSNGSTPIILTSFFSLTKLNEGIFGVNYG